ncbi:hypothetical protein EYF80_024179 [Liparis tanakae]|uniref:Uncharacterized protein n=1 Tax=Liparis tanakae TaxID=230148 RepID=A0A4Z2HJA4_9TELE|nr:hypothetical protein EYF80_024179 [Liparis tanakae]
MDVFTKSKPSMGAKVENCAPDIGCRRRTRARCWTEANGQGFMDVAVRVDVGGHGSIQRQAAGRGRQEEQEQSEKDFSYQFRQKKHRREKTDGAERHQQEDLISSHDDAVDGCSDIRDRRRWSGRSEGSVVTFPYPVHDVQLTAKSLDGAADL